MAQPQLAIVIPAYKRAFLRQAIESIAGQSCRDFRVYVGDDASPEDLKGILDDFQTQIDIVYRRFDQNIGGKDLVGQWERCLAMTQGEEWTWLFSDDDVMEPECVALFYKHISEHPDHNLVHFDIQTIDEKGDHLYRVRKFPEHCSSVEFFDHVLNRRVFSTVVEYIFRREIFEKVGGFQRFDLAWSSDNATWIKLASYGGIHTIEGAVVKWRSSGMNISSISDDKSVVYRKVNATVSYFNWARQFFAENKLTDHTSDIDKLKYIMIAVVYTTALDYNEKYQLIMATLKGLGLENLKVVSLMIWFSDEMKKRVKKLISYKGY